MFPTHDPQTDLLLPLPGEGESWDPHTVYNYAYLFNVAEAGIGVFAYAKNKPAFPLVEGGLCIFKGFDNQRPADMEFCDYQMTMPWAGISDGNKLALDCGLTIEIVEPGQVHRLTYLSPDGKTSVDITATGVTPLLARGHIIPGEEHKAGIEGQSKGGSEQLMHYEGEIAVNGERFDVDCVDGRDRSWGQVRSESRDSTIAPPAFWTPVCFDESLMFNQVGCEARDTDPSWEDVIEVPEDRPTHYFAWAIVDGEPREMADVRLDVIERHPVMHCPIRFEVEATDATGQDYSLSAEAIGASAIPSWPMSVLHQMTLKWDDGNGRTAFSSAQEMYWDQAYQHAMNERSRVAEEAVR